MWNNRVILSQGTLEKTDSVTHLIDGSGNILDLKDLNAKYSSNCSNEIYNRITEYPKCLAN